MCGSDLLCFHGENSARTRGGRERRRRYLILSRWPVGGGGEELYYESSSSDDARVRACGRSNVKLKGEHRAVRLECVLLRGGMRRLAGVPEFSRQPYLEESDWFGIFTDKF